MNVGNIELPDGWEVVGYRESYYTYRNGRICGHYIDLDPDEAVIEASGTIWKSAPRFCLGCLRSLGTWLVIRETTRYVQVDYSTTRRLGAGRYTYIDPTGLLAVGDLVEVPVTFGTKVGIVVALGRGSWTGECKAVAARLTREAL